MGRLAGSLALILALTILAGCLGPAPNDSDDETPSPDTTTEGRLPEGDPAPWLNVTENSMRVNMTTSGSSALVLRFSLEEEADCVIDMETRGVIDDWNMSVALNIINSAYAVSTFHSTWGGTYIRVADEEIHRTESLANSTKRVYNHTVNVNLFPGVSQIHLGGYRPSGPEAAAWLGISCTQPLDPLLAGRGDQFLGLTEMSFDGTGAHIQEPGGSVAALSGATWNMTAEKTLLYWIGGGAGLITADTHTVAEQWLAYEGHHHVLLPGGPGRIEATGATAEGHMVFLYGLQEIWEEEGGE